MTAKIKLSGVTKSFGPKVVLDGVDLAVAAGESVVVIGGSGVGKSVLLKCILGLVTPNRGSIEVDGTEVVGLGARARDETLRKFGMLFQSAALFDSLSVWENVAFGLIEGMGMARDQARVKAIETLARVGLAEDVAGLDPGGAFRRHEKTRRSGPGHRNHAGDLVFDEPTTGLDPIMGDVINDLIAKSVRELGATALSITHDLASARKIADRIAMLHAGRIIWQGPVADIDHSGNEFVDQFIHGRAEGPIQMEVLKP